MLLMALSCHLDTTLTADSVGSAFTDSQLLRGVGTILGFVFLNQAAIASVKPSEAGDAAGLFSAARNIGGSFALAGIATLQDQRSYLHSRRLDDLVNANSLVVQDYLRSSATALQQLGGTIQREALVMTYNDLFWLLSVGICCVVPLVLFLRPLPQGKAVAMH